MSANNADAKMNNSTLSGRAMLAARVSERCETCGVERARGSTAPCRCAAARWRPFCTRCAKPIDGDLCPHCLSVAETNGRKLRANLDAALVRDGGLAGVGATFARLSARATTTLREFGLDSAVEPIPDWAARLADKSIPLPPGAEHSRVKLAAINELRVEDAAVRLALANLGYSGRPTDEKLAKAVEGAGEALALLQSWDGIAAGAEHEQTLRFAAETLAASLQTASTVLESVRRRDLSKLVEASVRRARALRNCQSALGVG